MNRSQTFWYAVLCIGFGHTAEPQAATFWPMGFAELVDSASVVIEGRVVNTESLWNKDAAAFARGDTPKGSASPALPPKDPIPELIANGAAAPIPVGTEGGRMILTRVTLETIDVIKGSPGSTVDLMVAGGALNGLVAVVPGMPQLAQGQRYLLFLRNGYQKAADPFVGGNQGFFQVVRHPETGADVLLDANSDYVIGVEDDRVILRQNRAAERLGTRPAPLVAGPPVPDQPGVKAQLSAEVQRYKGSTDPLMTPVAFAKLIRSQMDR